MPTKKTLRQRRKDRRKNRNNPIRLPDESPAGNPNDFLNHLEKLVRAGNVIAIVLYSRVSSEKQRPNLQSQIEFIRQEIEKLGVDIIGEHEDVVPGWENDRPGLDDAIKAAKANGPGTIIVSESTDRFLRHSDYNETKSTWPTVGDFEKLVEISDGVTMATVFPPDTAFNEVRRHQTRRGQVAKGNHGGRPATKRGPYEKNHNREYAINKLTWFYRLGIIGKKKIAKMVNRPPSTVRGWIKQWEGHWKKQWPKPKKKKGGEFFDSVESPPAKTPVNVERNAIFTT